MSLQWTAVATFLYAEVFAVLLLCIPFISPKRWQKIFKSRLVELVVTYSNTFFVVLIAILVLLVIDAVREISKYDDVTEKVNLQNNPGAVEHFHMKLFRAQRNLYIAGFSLLLSFLLRRLVTLISQQATLLASNEAFKKQAESASEAAKKYMEENEKLKEAAGGGVKLDAKEAKLELANSDLQAELKKLKDELATNKQKLEKAENEALAMRKQSEGLTKEYDRLLEEHRKIQVSMPCPALLEGRPLCTGEAAALLLQALQEPLAVGAAPSLSLPLSPLLLNLGPAARTLSWAGGVWSSRWQPLTKVVLAVGLASCPASVSLRGALALCDPHSWPGVHSSSDH
ncbi:B-cell receptor-associated protein 31 [Myotis brandtii]|uniref:B-cell receptor-associated protein n=1 Tax=Myotis brandtii TaxID=109478 RepID=S7NTH9_MYOBR|nr:B-cell receptor-associated protein 31 [Myotis brandtii]